MLEDDAECSSVAVRLVLAVCAQFTPSVLLSQGFSGNSGGEGEVQPRFHVHVSGVCCIRSCCGPLAQPSCRRHVVPRPAAQRDSPPTCRARQNQPLSADHFHVLSSLAAIEISATSQLFSFPFDPVTAGLLSSTAGSISSTVWHSHTRAGFAPASLRRLARWPRRARFGSCPVLMSRRPYPLVDPNMTLCVVCNTCFLSCCILLCVAK